MKRIFRICAGIDVSELVQQLDDHPELWGQYTLRTGFAGSPFEYAPDIWVRYRAFEELTSPMRYLEAHLAVFYPAWDAMPALRPIVFDLMRKVEGVLLAGILITRIPSGGNVAPHKDDVGWHPQYTDAKAFVTLRGGDGCIFRCDGDEQEFKVGEAWTFDNTLTHSVDNSGQDDQITLIVCMRSAGGNYVADRLKEYRAIHEENVSCLGQ